MAGDPLYKSSAWRRVRRQILERDGHVCQVRGPKCTVDADHVDHIVPVDEGGHPLDPGNLRASCAACNIGRAARNKARNGWRRSATRITLVWGPPAAGKTTYANRHRGDGDIIVDFDAMARALGSTNPHDHTPGLVEATKHVRNALFRQLKRGELDGVPRVWILSTHPNAPDYFPHHDHILLAPGLDETLAQAERDNRPPQFTELIRSWYNDHHGHTGAPPSRNW